MSFPHTKWCGPGNKAKNYKDLGYFRDVDMCCRDHDHCKISVAAGANLRNYKNEGMFTESACYCDERLEECLKSPKINNQLIATLIGSMYFELAKETCLIAYSVPNEGIRVESVNYIDYDSYKSKDQAKTLGRIN
ncbi:hypothetical protein Ciccas_013621 [Cichlidogyrus casuarinus]|uniref:Phospholipase A2-like central domain-containing protein n=1 Tax=Cichlidogyrus casuarinus TaxID=1844966 RepID=A0ABD2PL78_9PLAT